MSRLEKTDKDLIVDKIAVNDDYNARDLAHIIREQHGTPCTPEDVEDYLEKESTQEKIETRRSVMEKNADYTRQQLINEMIAAKEEVSEILADLREKNKSKSMVEAAGELRKTLELLGKTIDALNEAEQKSDQYIRIDELSVDIIADALDSDDVKKIVEEKNGLRVERSV